MIPTKTGAAAAIGEVIPSLEGRLDGLAVRVPVINTSLLDVTVTVSKHTSVSEVNERLKSAAYGRLLGVLAYNELPLVSQDFNHNIASSVVDATQTKVLKNPIKVLAWYDNEWGFANRMLDTAAVLARLEAIVALNQAV
jgi:glyceraldehyde 3-phosphate dehydrogenase